MERLKYDARKVSPQAQEELRKKIVREMEKRDGNIKEVAEICECSVRHVQKTWKKYQGGGIKMIEAVKMGRPKGMCCKLTPEQGTEIKKVISEKKPSETGLSGNLWGRKEVSELVKQKLGIEIAVRTVGDYLAKWEFTYQRPKKKITDKTQKP